MANKEESVIIVKRKKGGGHGHHGGAWKVAFADFMTAMMAFFLVMWLMGSDEETKAAISHYFNHPNTPYRDGRDPASQNVLPLGEEMGQGDTILNGAEGQFPQDMVNQPSRTPSEALSEYKDLKSKVQSELEAIAYGMDLNLEHLKFSISVNELFEPGTSELKPGAEVILDKVGKVLSRYSGGLTIEGHIAKGENADQTGGVSSYEFTLSRAVSVMNYFVQKRYMSEDRIYPVGRGARRALATNSTPNGRERNQRIEFTLSYTNKL